jgi:hypothetical protein
MLKSLPRPWIIGGLGLVGSIWMLDQLTHILSDWLPALVIGSGLTWGYLKFNRLTTPLQPLSTRFITIDTVKGAVAEVEGMVNQLATEAADQTPDLAKLRLQIHEILNGLDRAEIRVAILGGQGVGKTTLSTLLAADWSADIAPQQLHWKDTPALFMAGHSAEGQLDRAWQLGKTADLVLFLTDGDLTDSQLQVLQQLQTLHRRMVLLFNKQDQYLPKEQTLILDQLRDRVSALIRPEDVVAIATQPRPIKVRQHQDDGTVKEWLEEPPPQIQPLTDRLTQILLQEGQKLVLASSLGYAQALKTEARSQLNAARRDRALPLIERTQWLVAGTAFATPFPAVDLLAAAAINGQMIVELGKLYQKPLAIDQAQTIAKALAGLMLKLGVVEAATQAIAALLKTNAITYAAGGLAQGVSGAYFTRLAGLTLIEYFETEAQPQRLQSDKLQTILQTVFQQNQRTAVLQLFVRQVVDKLIADTPSLPARQPLAVKPRESGELELDELELDELGVGELGVGELEPVYRPSASPPAPTTVQQRL